MIANFALAAPALTADHILGSLGLGGAAGATTVILILSVKGRGKVKFSHEAAGFTGFVAGTLYIAAGQIWQGAPALTESLTNTITGPNGIFGNAGQGAVAVAIAAWFWMGNPRPGKGALQGIAAASIFGTAGGLWQIFPAMVLSVLGHLGVK